MMMDSNAVCECGVTIYYVRRMGFLAGMDEQNNKSSCRLGWLLKRQGQ